ncbi:MAG TPA: TlpA disulfide reductase family protein [Prolixibacteraceae bacterium]|nr:TlpA disulfide reductase family protein [Prolixibacteraceae bacterium]
MNRLIIFALIIIVLSSCNNNNFSIEGRISNAQTQMVYLDKLNINGTTPFDSSRIDANGKFKISGSVSYPTFFLLRLNDQKFITLLIDSTEKVQFSADYLNFSKDYRIDGSIGSEKVKLLNDKLAKTNTTIDSLQSMLNLFASNNNYQLNRQKWVAQIDSHYTAQQQFSKKFVEENPFSLASVLAIYQKFNDGNYVMQDLQTLKMAASALHSMYPKSVHALTLYNDTEKLVQDIKAQEMRQIIQQYGVNSPEINLPDHQGNKKALSAFRGKYVLLHFWSATDRGSRIMNQVLSENYKQFKSKGFEIYQVSVDTDREAWLTAIEDDNLTWTNVGDMEGSIAAVNSYNISRIPYNYLIDKEGNIITKDLKGPAILNTLSKILN